MKFNLIGDKLSRDHGENRCRILLRDILSDGGNDVTVSYKLSGAALRSSDVAVCFPGGGSYTFLYEFFVLASHLLRRSKVIVWHHNSSFGRWDTTIKLLKKLGNVTELCLTRHQVRERGDAEYFPNTIVCYDLRARKQKKLIWLSRLEVAKGIDVAWEVAERLHAEDAEWTFDIVGPEGDWPLPELPDYVTYHGGKFGEDKFKALANAGVFILPSVYFNETQPLVVLEALSVGLPVVISDHNGIDELIHSDGRDAGRAASARGPVDGYMKAVLDSYAEWEACHETALHLSEHVYSMAAFRSRVDRIFGTNLASNSAESES